MTARVCNPVPKQERYRNKRIRDFANGQACTMGLPVCNHDPSTTVLAHSNKHHHGKGIGLKAHDCFAAFMCSSCHNVYDGRMACVDIDDILLDWTFDRARDLTLLILLKEGVLK